MIGRAATRFGLAVCAFAVSLACAETAPPGRRSGFDDMSPESRALQQDDLANPGMLSVADGQALWEAAPPGGGPSCASCHGDAATSMRGVATRYPAFSAEQSRPVDLQGRINLCRQTHQNATPYPLEGRDLLALTAYVANQSRGMPIAPNADPRLATFRARGEALYRQRQGQLNLSCAQCHDEQPGQRLGSALIPQGHPTGYPLYRLEWQSLGSLQRRFRNCMTGVRAEPYPFGSEEYVDLELFLMDRAGGMALETPAVRP